MKKRIQRLAISSLFVLSVGTIGAIIAEVSLGTAYAITCGQCAADGSCPGTPAGKCSCPPFRGACQPSQ
jgi:hypothetical protein